MSELYAEGTTVSLSHAVLDQFSTQYWALDFLNRILQKYEVTHPHLQCEAPKRSGAELTDYFHLILKQFLEWIALCYADRSISGD